MSNWDTISIKFDPFAPLIPPLKTALTVLQTVEAVLEALLALIKAFLLDLLNPLKAIISLLLAAIRTILNQIRSTGFSILLVHPDFSQPDFAAVLNSVSGPYQSFESKVVGKFFDTSDVFRPTYPDNSTVGMLVFYIGADTPGDLMTQLFALLAFIRHPIILSGLPAPINLRAVPVNKSGSAVSQFKNLFSSDLNKALQVEWSMPTAPSGKDVPGFLNSAVSFFNSFRFPNFVVERSELPQGEVVKIDLDNPTVGKSVDYLTKKLQVPSVNKSVSLVELDGSGYREFAKKIPINSNSGLVEGAFTGTYRYLDDDPSLISGQTYYYRVRAYFGSPTEYLSFSGSDSVKSSSLVKTEGNRAVIKDYGGSVVMGKPSAISKGFVPRTLSADSVFNAYTDIYEAVKAGILLNFEFPPSGQGDDQLRVEQKTGWGTLSIAGGQIGMLKSAYKDAHSLRDSFLLKTTARRISNNALGSLRSKPALLELLQNKWAGGASGTTKKVLESKRNWKFISVIGGFSRDSSPSSIASTPTASAGQVQQNALPNKNIAKPPTQRINSYLLKESNYRIDKEFDGPCPVRPVSNDSSITVTVEERKDLAEFIRITLAAMSGQTSYLSWYSVTVGDLFPVFIPFLNDLEQFILAMLRAINSALKEITDIIETIIQKIQALEQLLKTIIQLMELLKINIKVGVLLVGPTQGSAASLAQSLLASENKPVGNPYGLHSGLVMTFGIPGGGSLAALNAIKFILTLGG